MKYKNYKLKLIFNSIIYSFSGILLKCFSFFLLPLYTAYLTTEDYGITSLCTSFITTSSFIVAFSLFSAVMRFYVDLKNDQKKLKRFYGTIVIFIFISALLFGILITIYKNIISKYIFPGIHYYPFILISLISLVFYCQQVVYTNILQSQQKAVKFSIINIVFFFITLVLNIFFIVILKKGAVGFLLAMMISYIIYTMYFMIDIIKNKQIIFCLDLKLLKEALKYSIPIIPHNLSTQLAVLVSKILIGDGVSIAGVGIYSIASQFGSIADTIQSYVDQAYGPWLYEKLHDEKDNFQQEIRDISKILMSILGLFFLGISLFSQDYILLFMHSSYASSWYYISPIVLVFTIKTAYYFYVEILFYYKEASKKLFLATFIGSMINIIFTYFLVPIYGIYGSIVADAFSMIIRVGIVILISKQYNNVGLHILDFIKNFLFVSIMITIGLIFSYIKFKNNFNIGNFFYKCFIIIIYITIVLIGYKAQLKKILYIIKYKK